MKPCHSRENQTWRRVLRVASAAVLAGAAAIALPQPADAASDGPARVPANIRVPAGNTAFFEGHASGTQDYLCLPSGSGFAWTLFGPQATLFNDQVVQVVTHFLSPNPSEHGTPRSTWQHSRDTSAVWAQAIASSSDSNFVAPGAIPWLLLQVVGAQEGPTGGVTLTKTTFIQRLNTTGGVAPSTGCGVSTDIGKKALVPYTAVYVFYRERDN
jgi:uncharacterized protein DUF3455